jgi:uncharacterized membrane protein
LKLAGGFKIKTHRILIWAIVLALLLSSPVVAEVIYDIIDLGALGGDWSGAGSINNKGQIVGASLDAAGEFRAVLFDPTGGGNNTDLGEGTAQSINDNGQIVGNSYYLFQAVIFDSNDGGENIYLGEGTEAVSINNSGQIAGSVGDQAALVDSTGQGNHVLMGNGRANGINDIGQVVGQTGTSWATLFDPTGGGDNILLDTISLVSSAYAVNNSGQVVGSSWVFPDKFQGGQGWNRATLFDITGQGNNIDLGTMGELESSAVSINNKGRIVGWCGELWEFQTYATLFDETGDGNDVDLNDLIDPNAGWRLIIASCINDKGWIVGTGYNPADKTHAYLLIPLPMVVEAEVEIGPKTLNLQSNGKSITCYIWLPEDYNVGDIDANSVQIEEEITAGWVGSEGRAAVVKFSRSAVQEMLAELDELGEVELLVTGELADGTVFEGTDTITVIDKGRKK